MPEIICDVKINVTPELVYGALIDQQQMEDWWTECYLKPEVGSTAVFYFRAHGGYKRMRIEKLQPHTLVEWYCEDHFLEGQSDWIGTTIRFEIKANGEAGSELHFEHVNWKDTGGCYHLCTQGWNTHIIGLKEYLETGKGRPYDANCPTTKERHEKFPVVAR